MTHFEDLSRYEYWDGPVVARNVGWLERARAFPVAEPRAGFLDALWEHCWILVMPTRGLHECDLCPSPSVTYVRHGTRLLLGSGEIRVFDGRGDVFAAPNLIYHYVLEHRYRPPEDFVRAVEGGPRPGSTEYTKALDALAVNWRHQTPVAGEPTQFRFVKTANGVEREERRSGGDWTRSGDGTAYEDRGRGPISEAALRPVDRDRERKS